jgi:hypothetical protein
MAVGSKNLTGSGSVTTLPCRVYAVTATATSGGASSVTLKNNGTSGTLYDQIDISAASKNASKDYSEGLLFPNGCYVTFDGNTSYVTVAYALI